MNIWKFFSRIQNIRGYVPMWLKSWIRRRFLVLNYDKLIWEQDNPFRHIREETFDNPEYPFTLGIFKEFSHRHKNYIIACREMKISYKILDLTANDWIHAVNNSGCDAFLVWPSPVLTLWKQIYDERIKILIEELGKIVYPSYNEIWIYENKRRMRDWMMANNIPVPKTDIFYDPDAAMDFIRNETAFPVILKLNHGAAATGIFLLHTRKQAERLTAKIFKKGITVRNGDPRDVQWGHVIFQEFLPDIEEWRMVRVGDSYFGHQKGKDKQFHSGSGKVIWKTPSTELLNFTRNLTDAGRFTSMDVDIFETPDNQWYVNELQTVFGASHAVDQLKINGKVGRFRFNEQKNEWEFEEGDFAKNACTNLRVQYLINQLKKNGK